MTDSILKQMGIQQWRLRQSEPVRVVESQTAENPAVQAVSSIAEPQAVNEPPFDPNQMWSNDPSDSEHFSHDEPPLPSHEPSPKRPLSEGLGLKSQSNKPKSENNRIATPTAEAKANQSSKPMPAPLPKLMPAPAPLVTQDSAPAPVPTLDNSVAVEVSGDQTGYQANDSHAGLPETCSSTSSILGSGNANAEWMFITDAPSQGDLPLQQLFSGRAGQLYEAMLLAVGLDRTKVYTSSVFKCTVPADQSLSPNCDKLLRRQIELVKPNVIITFGEFASQSVLRSNETLDVLRTQQNMCHQTQTPVVATYNPMQLLEHAELKAGAWQDLKKCLALLK